MSEKINWEYLLEKYTANSCSKEELHLLLDLIEKDQDSEGLTSELRKHWAKTDNNAGYSADWKERFSVLMDEARIKLPATRPSSPVSAKHFIKWASMAAAVLVVIGGYFLLHTDRQAGDGARGLVKIRPKDRMGAPGGNKAVLTLADGSTIDLDSAGNGTVARQGNIKIIKGEDGELLYFVDRQRSASDGYNTISTPRGGRYTIVLSDGTKVWLNAASSLKFPAFFTHDTRTVTLTGEGYFEVTKDPSMPFHVMAGNMGVEVLGTHFNVNAYSDESTVSTTLLEGAVKVKPVSSPGNDESSSVLKPGQQANYTATGTLTIDREANTSEATAWKDNNFEFENTPIPVIMRQISRWYDVEIDYKGVVPSRRLTGKFSRNVSLGQLIGMLQYTGLDMKVENNRIIIQEN